MLADLKTDIFHCLKCGACRLDWETSEPICPSGMKYGFDSYYAIGRISLARAVMEGSAQLNSEMMKRVYSCTSCGACDVQCNPAVGIAPLNIIEEFKFEAVEKGLIPPEIRDFLKSINIHGNPYLLPATDRGKWAEGLDIPEYAGQEYLFYVGCVGSYDERAKKLVVTLAKLFLNAGVSFGVLGDKELCDGNEVNKVGERGLFEFMAEQNITLFKELGVKKIVTFSPHGFNAIKSYAKFGADLEVLHYTQFLRDLVRSGEITLSKDLNSKSTYHDPCFLGRHNDEYDASRFVLSAIPGLSVVEMERCREHSLCCGGGGGNFFTDVIGSGVNSPSRIRVREAANTGADTIVVACPNCHNMLDDAIKTEELEGTLVVKDLAQLVMESAFQEK